MNFPIDFTGVSFFFKWPHLEHMEVPVPGGQIRAAAEAHTAVCSNVGSIIH